MEEDFYYLIDQDPEDVEWKRIARDHMTLAHRTTRSYKVDAIKELRIFHKMDLRSAKHVVEEYIRRVERKTLTTNTVITIPGGQINITNVNGRNSVELVQYIGSYSDKELLQAIADIVAGRNNPGTCIG